MGCQASPLMEQCAHPYKAMIKDGKPQESLQFLHGVGRGSLHNSLDLRIIRNAFLPNHEENCQDKEIRLFPFTV